MPKPTDQHRALVVPARTLQFSVPLTPGAQPLAVVAELDPDDTTDATSARFLAWNLRRACPPAFVEQLVVELLAQGAIS